MSLKNLFDKIDSVSTYPKTGPKFQAILKENFEPRVVKKIVKGKETEVIVPRIKANTKFPVIKMDMFWMTPQEKGGVGLDIGVMEYWRLTNPDGTPTKYYDLFDYIEVGKDDVVEAEEIEGNNGE